MFRRFDNAACCKAPACGFNEMDVMHVQSGCVCGQNPCTCRGAMQHNDMHRDMVNGPIVEPKQVRVEHRDIIHPVEHICPIETKIINHHIYKHSYRPCYETVCEEQVSHVGNTGCCR